MGLRIGGGVELEKLKGLDKDLVVTENRGGGAWERNEGREDWGENWGVKEERSGSEVAGCTKTEAGLKN